MSGGFCVTTHKYLSGAPTCYEFCLDIPAQIMIKPELFYVYYMSPKFYLQAGLSLPLIVGDTEETFPYSSGVLLQIGIAYETGKIR
jgi:hypothetical protein